MAFSVHHIQCNIFEAETLTNNDTE